MIENKVKLAKAMNLCIVLEIVLLATKKEIKCLDDENDKRVIVDKMIFIRSKHKKSDTLQEVSINLKKLIKGSNFLLRLRVLYWISDVHHEAGFSTWVNNCHRDNHQLLKVCTKNILFDLIWNKQRLHCLVSQPMCKMQQMQKRYSKFWPIMQSKSLM